MYIFLLVVSTIITYTLLYTFNLKKLCKESNKLNLLIISFITTTLLNNIIIYVMIGNINLTDQYFCVTPIFIIKYIIMTIIVSIVILFGYIQYLKNIKINKYGKKVKTRYSNIFTIIIIFLIVTLYMLTKDYPNITIEQLVFHLDNPLTNAAYDVILSFLKTPIIITLLIFTFLYYQQKLLNENKIQITYKDYHILPYKYYKKKNKIILFIVLIVMIIFTLNKYKIKDFIYSQILESNFIDENYINPDNVKIDFPEKKRNLIYIYVESMEKTFADYTPNLNKFFEQNTSFSSSDNYELGFKQLEGISWTMSSMVAQTAGLPLKFTSNNAYYNSKEENFLNKATTLGEILASNGYKNYLYLGSDSNFASKKNYFEQNGNYEIFDYNSAIEKKYIDKDYKEWWGFEDKKLFKYSKQKLLSISKNNEPFNFTILTADTHPSDGYLEEDCEIKYEEQLANVLECTDSMIGEFVKWLEKQEFYNNTTIIIVGDHNYMEANPLIDKVKERNIYDVILNSFQEENLNIRKFSAFDMFPTTLATLGVKIEGERLGLGTNLYSSEQTIIEKYNKKYVEKELKKKSKLYNEISK